MCVCKIVVGVPFYVRLGSEFQFQHPVSSRRRIDDAEVVSSDPEVERFRYQLRFWCTTDHTRPMHHLTCGINSLLHSVNLIVFTVLLVHLILRISPHHNHHLRSHHLSPRSFTSDLKLISFTNPFLRSLLIPSGLTLRILNLY